MIPLAIPNLNGNEARYLQECVNTNFVSAVGPFVDRFEELLCESTGSTYSVATSSGTTGLQLALATVGVQPGDLVILPTFTFIASANAISHCGAMPWLMDVDDRSWTLDPDHLAESLERECRQANGSVLHVKSGARVAAIMPVYTLGTPADMWRISETAREWGLPVLADAAAAIGAKYRDHDIGQLATLSVASFNGNKTVTCGGGGGVFGVDEDLIGRARHLGTTARVGDAYDHDEVGFNFRMTNLQAAVGCAQLERLSSFLVRKTQIADTYRSLAEEVGARPFPIPDWAASAHWLSGLLLDSADQTAAARHDLRSRGIDARPFWKPVHLQVPYRDAPREATPVAEMIWERLLVLPSSTGITDDELAFVVHSCHGAVRL